MSPSPLDYLRHILDEADFLIRVAATMEKESFLRDVGYEIVWDVAVEKAPQLEAQLRVILDEEES